MASPVGESPRKKPSPVDEDAPSTSRDCPSHKKWRQQKATPRSVTRSSRGPSLSARDKEILADAAVNFVCADVRPFNAIEGEGMRALAQALINVGAKYGKYGGIKAENVLPSRHKVKDCTLERANDIKLDLAEDLKRPVRDRTVAFTTDIWTDDFRKTSYLELSASFVDSNYNMRQALLQCCEIQPWCKTGRHILDALTHCGRTYGIGAEDLSNLWFVTDCGSNFVAALRSHNRLDCLAHRLNTALRTSWEKTEKEVAEAMQFKKACSDLVRFAKDGYLQSHLNTTLKAEATTRWNSHYISWNSIMQNYDRLVELLSEQDECRMVDSINRNLLEELTRFLKYFFDLSNKISAGKSPTLQMVLPTYHNIMEFTAVDEMDSTTLKVLKQHLTIQARLKIRLEDIHYEATFLDPSMRSFPMLGDDERKSVMETLTGRVVEKMAYAHDVQSDPEDPTPPKAARLVMEKVRQLRTTDSAPKNELLLYQQTPVPRSTINPLDFWRDQRERLPLMAKVAARILVVPATSASSERTFSVAGRVVDQRRCRLDPKTVDAILRVRSSL